MHFKPTINAAEGLPEWFYSFSCISMQRENKGGIHKSSKFQVDFHTTVKWTQTMVDWEVGQTFKNPNRYNVVWEMVLSNVKKKPTQWDRD